MKRRRDGTRRLRGAPPCGLVAAAGVGLLILSGCQATDSAGGVRQPLGLAARAAAALAETRVEVGSELAVDGERREPSADFELLASGAEERSRGVVLGGGGQDARDVLDDLRETSEIQKGASKALVEEARSHVSLSELEEAEIKLTQALGYWSENDAALELLDEVRMLRGDRRGELPYMARMLRDQLEVERKLLTYEIERHLNKGEVAMQEGEFSAAIDSFRRAADGIRHAPYDLDADHYLARAREGLRKAEESLRAKEEKDRLAIRRIAEEQKELENRESFQFVQNHIRALRRRATSSLENRDFRRAAELYGQILELDPHDEDALQNRAMSLEKDHVHTLDRLLRQSVENFEKAVLSVEESSIVYQKIFRYPDKDEWLRISPKVISIEEQAEREESVVTKNIRLRLSQPVSFGIEEETPLRDCLADLQRLSGVNFFIQGDGSLGDTGITLEQLNNLPLQDVLTFMLRKVGSDDVGFVIRDGAVVIAQGEENLKPPQYLRFYEVSDIVTSRPDFPAPELALDSFAGQQDDSGGDISFGGDEEELTTAVDSEELLDLIAKELGAASGEDDASLPEGIRILNGKLMALTTVQNHYRIATILDRLRKATGMMVTVESRFLDIQDNFLEEIGINIGSGSTTNLPNTIPDIDGAGTAVAPGYEFIDARGDFNLRAATIGALSNPLGSQVNPFNISSSGGGAYQVNVIDAERFQLEALLTAVAKEQEVRRLNSPRVTAFNTQTSHTLVVNQAAYIQDLEVNQTGVIPVINPVIGVLNTGSILEVRPTISFDRKYVVLEIQPTLAEQIGQDVAILTLAGNFTVVPVQLPIVSVTKIKTTVNVPDGGTVLLGGLKREIRSKTTIGLPALRRIPIVNLFFGRRGESALRSNLFVLINTKVTVVYEEEERLFGTGI